MVGSKPGTNSLSIIIRTPNKLDTTATVANAHYCRFLKFVVVPFATSRTRIPTSNTFCQRCVINDKFHNRIETFAKPREHGVERLRLWNRPRKTIQNKARRTIRPYNAPS